MRVKRSCHGLGIVAIMVQTAIHIRQALSRQQTGISERSVLADLHLRCDRIQTLLQQLLFKHLGPTAGVDTKGIIGCMVQHSGIDLLRQLRFRIIRPLQMLGTWLVMVRKGIIELAKRHIRRILRDRCRKAGIHIRLDPVVAVYKAYILPFCHPQTGLPCGHQAAVGLMHHLHPRVLADIGITNGRAVVRRAVIHQHNIQVRVSLGQNTVHALTKIGFHFIYGNNYANGHKRSLKMHPNQ